MSNSEIANKHLSTIAKTLAYLCMTSTDMKNQSVRDKAKFLRSLGFADKDVAALLNTSENSIRVLISLGKKSKQKKSKPKTHTKEEQ